MTNPAPPVTTRDIRDILDRAIADGDYLLADLCHATLTARETAESLSALLQDHS